MTFEYSGNEEGNVGSGRYSRNIALRGSRDEGVVRSYFTDVWTRVHVAGYNARNLTPEARAQSLEKTIKRCPSRVADYPLATLEYELTVKGGIELRVCLQKTGKVFRYYPASTVCPQSVRDELEEASWEEENH